MAEGTYCPTCEQETQRGRITSTASNPDGTTSASPSCWGHWRGLTPDFRKCFCGEIGSCFKAPEFEANGMVFLTEDSDARNGDRPFTQL